MGDLPPILLAIGQHFLKLRPRICPCGLFIREDFEHGQAVVRDYEGMLRRYIRPTLGERVLAAMRPLDLQTTYQQMIERGLSPRTVRYTHVVLRSAMRQAVQWRLLLENPADGLKLPQQSRNEMRAL